MQFTPDNPYYDAANQIKESLKDAGYTDQMIEFRNYFSGQHFDEKYTEIFAEFVNAKPLFCNVNEIRPGKCLPWHWDINSSLEEQSKLGELVRFICFLSKPAPGHIFVTDEDAYYMEPQGAIYQYSDMHMWHAGSNVGLVPKFVLTLTAYR